MACRLPFAEGVTELMRRTGLEAAATAGLRRGKRPVHVDGALAAEPARQQSIVGMREGMKPHDSAVDAVLWSSELADTAKAASFSTVGREYSTCTACSTTHIFHLIYK